MNIRTVVPFKLGGTLIYNFNRNKWIISILFQIPSRPYLVMQCCHQTRYPVSLLFTKLQRLTWNNFMITSFSETSWALVNHIEMMLPRVGSNILQWCFTTRWVVFIINYIHKDAFVQIKNWYQPRNIVCIMQWRIMGSFQRKMTHGLHL